jgi:pimeloyl-ACP methyl ester carboxylesterase
MFRYRQLRRSFYIWLIQQVGLAETALLEPGFWEGLWADWSPGYDAADDIAMVRRHITADTVAEVVCPYRASFNEAYADPDCAAEAAASLTPPQLPTLYLHGADDGGMGADILADPAAVLAHPRSVFALVPGVGHFLHLEQPEAIWARIRDWLAG